MLSLTVSDDFRQKFRAWLNKNPPPAASKIKTFNDFLSVARAWQAKLSESRWLAVHWPEQYGGRGLTLSEEAVVQEELARRGAPQLLGLFGITMVGPVLIEHGTEEQKQRYLSNILSAKEIWCQGFSEPGAGSDLASLKTKAVQVDGGFLVSGQKVWTSFAQVADWCFLLCRTSNEEKKHRGMSYLLVDMRSKGISVRPLKQITGDEEFNEVFFDEVFVPSDQLVGEVGGGWKIAISTLMYERVILTFARMLQSEVYLRELIKSLKKNDPYLREISKLTASSSAVRALAYKHLLSYKSGQSPGPEGSLDKLFWSENFQNIAKAAFLIAGREAGLNEEESNYTRQYLYSRGRTIAAGTSEIQRNIIAERLLGLSRGS